MARLILSFIFSFLILLSGVANNYRFFHISSQQGLPHQQVETMIQDYQGNIWLGTRNGLARYDGYSIKNYFNDSNNPSSLGHNFIKVLFLDHKHRVWVAHSKGVSLYRPATDDFENFKLPGNIIGSIIETYDGKIICGGSELSVFDEKAKKFTALPSLGEGFIISLAVDKDNQLYVATNSSIYSYNSKLTQITRLDSSIYRDFITGADGIIPMTFDHSGRLWIGRNGKGVMALDVKTGKTQVYEANRLSNGTVRVITEDHKHNIWLGTEQGVTILGPDGNIKILKQQFGNVNLLSDNAIYSILADANHNIWIGSYFGGVDMVKNSSPFSWEEPSYASTKLQGKVVRQIIERNPHELWIATEDGGVNIYNPIQGKFSPFKAIPTLGSNVHCLFYDKSADIIWIGTFRKGLFRYDMKSGSAERFDLSKNLSAISIFDFAKQRSGKLWVATTQGLYWYDRQSKRFKKFNHPLLSHIFIYSLAIDQSDNLWVGTVTRGIYKIDKSTNKIIHWPASRQPQGLKDNYITYIYPAEDGKVWVGTNNNGLQVLNSHDGKFSEIENEKALSKSTICSINADPMGHIWISTSQGLFQYIPKSRTINRYTTDDGLPTNQFNFSSTLLTQDGRMYFGTVNGLVAFRSEDMVSKSMNLSVHLKSLKINGEEINAASENSPLTKELDATSEIRLTYRQARSVMIDYGVISPGRTESIIYQTKVDGIDKQWREMADAHTFVSYNMEPGTYVLRIRANNSNTGWESCPEKAIKIIVAPPFYRSLWAYLFYLIIVAIIIYYIQHAYKIRLNERNKVKMAMMEKNKIEEIDRAKFDFFTIVSHELKTPLSLIIAPLKSIHKDELNNSDQHHLETALENTNKMEELINELVTFNKVESDKFPFYIQQGNPLEFITILANLFRRSAAEKHLNLSVDCENNDEIVWFSPSYLERIMNNLLSNAIKFTPENGEVKVKASIITGQDDDYTYLDVRVSDTGIGIAPEEQDRIFQKFYQTKRGYNANSKGWGIGLSLVQRLVTIHKGSIKLKSELRHGSTFRVLLNVDARAFEQQSLITDDKVIVPLKDYHFSPSMTDINNASQDIVEEDSKMSILIVEDNSDMLTFLADYFSPKYNVYTATNGKEGIEVAQNESIQLVISDVMMPVMDGVTFCTKLKSDVSTSHIPVILLTAKNEQEDVVMGYKSGAEAYVSKPFDPQVLDLQVNNIIQLVKTRQTEIQNTKTEDIEASSLNAIDKDFILHINQLIDKNIDNNDFSVADITREMAISRSLLHTKMKSLLNMSIGEYIRHKRLTLASELLMKGFTVAETAYRCGFSDPNYFSKVFKKFFGKSPSEFTTEH
ncbi:MAG: two-component regulator propeller domain-containing protein [Prevotella sp.]|jgi:signal transduction histidine kinase/ligand-binding sensor domain-containing protein/DNA-binding response OmpR family regulator